MGELKNKVIAIANQKGGVGKTTTTINLSAALALLNKKVLIIDIDPQGNTTSGLGVEKDELEKTIYQVILLECNIKDAIIKNIYPNLDLLPVDMNFVGAEIDLIDVPNREKLLKQCVEEIENEYDYIFLDCPPSLNILTVNAMTTADAVLIPVQTEYYALEGLTQLISTINLVKERINENLKIDGIVFTMVDQRTNLANDVIENVREHLDERIYNSVIPRNIRLAEAPSYGVPINVYDKKSNGAVAYEELAKEFIKYH